VASPQGCRGRGVARGCSRGRACQSARAAPILQGRRPGSTIPCGRPFGGGWEGPGGAGAISTHGAAGRAPSARTARRAAAVGGVAGCRAAGTAGRLRGKGRARRVACEEGGSCCREWAALAWLPARLGSLRPHSPRTSSTMTKSGRCRPPPKAGGGSCSTGSMSRCREGTSTVYLPTAGAPCWTRARAAGLACGGERARPAGGVAATMGRDRGGWVRGGVQAEGRASGHVSTSAAKRARVVVNPGRTPPGDTGGRRGAAARAAACTHVQAAPRPARTRQALVAAVMARASGPRREPPPSPGSHVMMSKPLRAAAFGGSRAPKCPGFTSPEALEGAGRQLATGQGPRRSALIYRRRARR
jgi:hypothetical protein